MKFQAKRNTIWAVLAALLILLGGVAAFLLYQPVPPAPADPGVAKRALMAQRRTYPTALTADQQPRPVLRGIIERMRLLPERDALAPDGMRLLAFAPGRIYAVVLRHRAAAAAMATGIVILIARRDGKEIITRHPFVMPAADYHSLMAEVDRLTDDWPGSTDLGQGYFPAAFERVRGGGVTSGFGSGGHYDQLQETVLGLVNRYAAIDYESSPAHEPEPFP